MTEVAAKTLTDNQQRRSLSGPKSVKGLNKNVRNVLAKPYAGFWPVVDSHAESELQELLESLLPAARKVVSAEDLKLLRNMKGKKMKEERAELRQKVWDNNPGSKKNRQNLVIGVNDVSRSLEENTLASLMISNEADPPILTRHLSTLAATRNVPFLVLQNLKKYTKAGIDISSLALGLKTSVAEDRSNHYHPIHLKVVDVFKTIAEKSLPMDPQDFAQLQNLELTVKLEETKQAALKDIAASKVQSRKQDSSSKLYLVRSSRKYRVFVPGKGTQDEDSSTCSQYISLSDGNENRIVSQTEKSLPDFLGSTGSQGARSFLQKVRDAKGVVFEPPSVPMETDAFISLASMTSATESQSDIKTEVQTEIETATSVKKEPVCLPKPVKRYFSTLVPLKIKRIQSNPQKVKTNPKGKKK